MANGTHTLTKIFFIIFLPTVVCVSAIGVQAAEIRVEHGQPIQAAIDRAQNGDVVVVEDGIYTGAGNVNLSFRGKSITVRSQNGPDNCIILGTTPGTRAFMFRYRERPEAVLSGFTIKGFSNYTMAYGGAIFIYYSSPTIQNCIIRNNASGYGGGIAIYGGSPLIQNCMIFGNYADYLAGGILIYYASYTRIINCTISGNQAGYYRGTGVYARSVYQAMLVNSIVWGNGIDEIEAPYSVRVMNCNVRGGYPGSGNFSMNPEFVDDDPGFDAQGDYRLKADSPCIDRGLWVYAPDTDIDGQSRLQDADPDIGADEWVGPY